MRTIQDLRHILAPKYLISLFFVGCLSMMSANAQFYIDGTDPGSVKWSSVKTQNFNIIFPRGLDSLAYIYGTQLEKWRIPVSNSIGYAPNQQYKKRMPVILHAYTGTANGSVTWTPRRMDLYTAKDAYSGDAMPWEMNLTIHESRHVSQMQFGKDGAFKVGHFLIGELMEGALAGIYPNMAFFEGDAVVAETALTQSGRGRSADFLEWYRVSLDNGDKRNFYRWRYSSQKKYTPNHYAIGYFTIAGVRYVYNAPTFTQRYYERLVQGNPIKFNNFQKTIKEFSGKNFKDSFDEISESYKVIWQNEDASRLCLNYDTVVSAGKRYTTYENGEFDDEGNFYAVKNTLSGPYYLVKVSDNGKEDIIRPFSGSTSKLVFSNQNRRLYWSEGVSDLRWDMKKTSRIRYFELGSKKIHDLTKEGRYYNPSVSSDGTRIATSEYPVEGGTFITILSSEDGVILNRIPVPQNLQVVETAWIENKIIASVIEENGYAIYSVDNGIWSCQIKAQPIKIKGLRSFNDEVYFTCDLTGVNEIYSFSKGVLSQITATKYGASDFSINGNELWFSNLLPEGRIIAKSNISSVVSGVDFIAHHYPIADKLSDQEKSLGKSDTYTAAEFSDVTPYRKGLHLLKLHSWAPIYINTNAIDNISLDYTYEDMGIGATAFFQNHLGTLHGYAGYSFHKDEYSSSWKNSGHIDLTYEGLFPVFELKLDFNDRNNIQYGWKQVLNGDNLSVISTKGTLLNSPSISGNLIMYIPLEKNSGGWYRGLIPQVKYNFSNDWFNTKMSIQTEKGNLDGTTYTRFEGSKEGKNVPMQSMTASLRGYIVESTPSSSIYPKLGIGIETGIRGRFNLADVYRPAAYFYSYGYLPGFHQTHGFKLTAIYQHQIGDGIFKENVVTTRPRGFVNSNLSRWLANNEKNQFRFTLDYAMPVIPVDWTFLCPLFYIRNFELIPHIDITTANSSFVYSAGTEFNVHLGNFLWLPYDTKFGVTWSYNGGPAYNSLLDKGVTLSRNYIGMVFNVAL